MIYLAVIAALPFLLAGAGFICRGGRRKALYCGVFGLLIFLGAVLLKGGEFYEKTIALFGILPKLSFDSMSRLAEPPAYAVTAKAVSALSGGSDIFFLITSAIGSAAAAYLVYSRCSVVYAGGLAFVLTGFFLCGEWNGCIFAAALISGFALRYACEKRFFRFAAYVVFAACFDMSALLLLPVYFLLIPENPIFTAVFAAVTASSALLLPEYRDRLFSFLYGRYSSVSQEIPTVIAVGAFTLLVLCLIAYKLMKQRGEYPMLCLRLLFFGAAFSLLSLFDSRFFPAALMTFLPASVTLTSELFGVASSLMELTFRERRKEAFALSAAVFLVIYAIYYIFLISSGVFGGLYSPLEVA